MYVSQTYAMYWHSATRKVRVSFFHNLSLLFSQICRCGNITLLFDTLKRDNKCCPFFVIYLQISTTSIHY